VSAPSPNRLAPTLATTSNRLRRGEGEWGGGWLTLSMKEHVANEHDPTDAVSSLLNAFYSRGAARRTRGRVDTDQSSLPFNSFNSDHENCLSSVISDKVGGGVWGRWR